MLNICVKINLIFMSIFDDNELNCFWTDSRDGKDFNHDFVSAIQQIQLPLNYYREGMWFHIALIKKSVNSAHIIAIASAMPAPVTAGERASWIISLVKKKKTKFRAIDNLEYFP